jgi:hypothetical protein
MQYASEQAEKDWNLWESVNVDPYSASCVRFTRKWAETMEQHIAKGETVAECAQLASEVANIGEGVTGFQYAQAARALGEMWVHGKELADYVLEAFNIKVEVARADDPPNPTLQEV